MINIYVDGSMKPSVNKGGFGVVVIKDDTEILHMFRDEFSDVTNNKMELYGIIYACDWITTQSRPAASYIIYSDSSYCVNAINNWIIKWVNNGWKTSNGKEVKNIEEMRTLYNFFYRSTNRKDIIVKHIKGHQGNIGNELADALATKDKNKLSRLILSSKLKFSDTFIDSFKK